MAINGRSNHLRATSRGDIRRGENLAIRRPGIDPKQSFRLVAANFRFRIAKLTLPTKRLLCAAAIGSIVCFLRRRRCAYGCIFPMAVSRSELTPVKAVFRESPMDVRKLMIAKEISDQ